ncbi:MAG: homocysteine S-methyltransferase family protein [Phormidesmis sp.]
MKLYRYQLPQLDLQNESKLFITDGGLETDLIFLQGLHLPEFAAFVLLNDAVGSVALRRYFDKYVAIAHKYGTGLVLESPTWRANSDWGKRLDYDAEALSKINWKAIDLMHSIRREAETSECPMVVSGCVGPRGDGYSPDTLMDAQTAQQYHMAQIVAFADSEADMVSAITMTYAEEALGIAWAAQVAGMPVVISFTVETDGCLPSGQSLQSAIEQVDRETNGAVAYYMINCAHPTHFKSVLEKGGAWTDRIYGVRANASQLSHAELDEAETLDDGNPKALGADYVGLKEQLHNLTVLGGCCGTDYRHIEAICEAYLPALTLPPQEPAGASLVTDYRKEQTLLGRFFHL